MSTWTATQRLDMDASKAYPFVPSAQEHMRLNEQSTALNELMLGKISRAPLSQQPKKILDVGCGTGIQTRLLAELYPTAQVIGIDLTAVPEATTFPSNVTFILGRVEDEFGKHELLEPSSFDLIYHRYLVMVIQDWSEHITRMRTLLRPGGWIEIQEPNMQRTYDEHEQLVSSEWRYPHVIERGSAARGIDLEIAVKLPHLCSELGFVEVETKLYPQVYRPGWVARPETERLGTYIQSAMPQAMRPWIARATRPEDGEDAEELYQEFLEKALKGPLGYHTLFHVVTARRPAQ